MPTFTLTDDKGNQYRVVAPKGVTREQAEERLRQQAQPVEKDTRTWGQAAKDFPVDVARGLTRWPIGGAELLGWETRGPLKDWAMKQSPGVLGALGTGLGEAAPGIALNPLAEGLGPLASRALIGGAVGGVPATRSGTELSHLAGAAEGAATAGMLGKMGEMGQQRPTGRGLGAPWAPSESQAGDWLTSLGIASALGHPWMAYFLQRGGLGRLTRQQAQQLGKGASYQLRPIAKQVGRAAGKVPPSVAGLAGTESDDSQD